MTLQNFCVECGKKICPKQGKCSNCNTRTYYSENGDECMTSIPIYNIGFFNTQIDFSPFLNDYRTDYKYIICSCGYINNSNNEFCYNCGKKINGKLSKLFKQSYRFPNSKTKMSVENYRENLIDGLINFMSESDNNEFDNFNPTYSNSQFCFCGEEINPEDECCSKCGRPLKRIDESDEYRIYCSCGTLNSISNDFCTNCGVNLNDFNSNLICSCGTINDNDAESCSKCNRTLSKDRVILTKLVCKCGAILDCDTQYCPFCGNSIRKDMGLNDFSKKH